MRSKIVKVLLFSISLLVFFKFSGNITYGYHTKDFKKITLEDLQKMESANDDSFVVYLGRKTCPYCREFVPKLSKAAKEKGKTIYYVDTEKIKSDEDKEYLTTKLKLDYVPSLAVLFPNQETFTMIPYDEIALFEVSDIMKILSN